MARSAMARRLDQTPAKPGVPVVVHGGGAPPPAAGAFVSNARIAIAMLLGAETMFFTGLIGAYLVLRGASPLWPPPGLPRLPVAVTWANTLVFVISCVTMQRAAVAAAKRSPLRLERSLTITALLGTVFLTVQGSEWLRLIYHGLTVSAGVYGSTFYTLIGVHGLHVLAAVIWLLWVLARARGNRFSAANAAAVDLVRIYWHYVGAVWLILFPLVYLY